MTQKRALIALVLALASWSLSPLLISQCRGLAPAPIVALIAVSLGGIVAVAVGSVIGLGPNAVLRKMRKSGRIRQAAAVGLGSFVAYPLFYFSAIQSTESVVLVNLVNYLWPVAGFLIVTVFIPGTRSLEGFLAGLFGFSGAALAIGAAESTHGGGSQSAGPFLLAAAGAVTYGAVSAYRRIKAPSTEAQAQATEGLAVEDDPAGPTPDALRDDISFLLAALYCGAAVALTVLVAWLLIDGHYATLDFSQKRTTSLLIYSCLLPVAHLSWLTAVASPKIPSFASAYVVPITSTAVLALVLGEPLSPQTLSALVLVMCGITFAASAERGIPVAFAVTLAFLASVLIGQSLPTLIGVGHDSLTATLSTLVQVLVGLIAVFAGFVLTNSIARYGQLLDSCVNLIDAASTVSSSEIVKEVEALEVALEDRGNPTAAWADSSSRADLPPARFARQWAAVRTSLGKGVSAHEWLVLILGSVGVITALQLFAPDAKEFPVLLLKGFGVAVVVGVLFAIRDYDRNRPQRLGGTLWLVASTYGVALKKRTERDDVSRPLVLGRIGSPYAVGLTTLVVVASVAVTLNL